MEQMKRLTRREQEVVSVLLQGKTNKQIAFLLGVSERTIEFHLKNIYAKMQVNSKIELILWLGKSTGVLSENPEKTTVDVSSKNVHNDKQPAVQGNRWARLLKEIILICKKEFATMKITITRNRFLGINALVGMICGAVWGYHIGVSLGVIFPNLLINGIYGLILGISGAWAGFAAIGDTSR